ncbi:aminopeptidase [Oceanobacillus oncorhynchi subsp. incaldanensis]|uniref:M24 family metallopeptidase n=1 Tax=Oceanobacillus oncorhynchi TaxID=545501 RepID=UPI001B0D9839|nr:Xaa-Pro peptidase family protein [Oceanobacillus oncorhynchi]GIO18067.1 aminopeptidase [Oceanobacillus oncorhynchi subsp. incaldanensis]
MKHFNHYEPLFYAGDELHDWKLNKLNSLMKEQGLDALLLFKHDSVRYVTEFYTKGYRPFLDFDYLAIVPLNQEPIIGYSMGGEERRIQIRSKVNDSRKLPGFSKWSEAIEEILSDYNLLNKHIGFDLMPHFIHENLKKQLPGAHLIDISDIWSNITAIKHPLEIELIKKSLDIAQSGLRSAMNALAPGKMELEISAIGEFTMRQQGSELNPFIPVVASGENAAVWERLATEKQMNEGDMVVLDFGCVYKGYTGDFARTTIIGNPTEEQKNLYKAAYASLQEAMKNVKAGVLCSEIDKIARDVLIEHGYSKYQHPWATGHQLGYGLHGAPVIDRGVNAPLKAGMVINIEPSIYTYDDLSIGGVELEDTILVTETGYEKLTSFEYEAKLLD